MLERHFPLVVLTVLLIVGCAVNMLALITVSRQQPKTVSLELDAKTGRLVYVNNRAKNSVRLDGFQTTESNGIVTVSWRLQP